jgi:hypothetical protein
MTDIFITLICAIMFAGGALACIGESMADIRGDSGAGFWPLVIAVIGLLGLIVEVVRGIIAFVRWLL